MPRGVLYGNSYKHMPLQCLRIACCQADTTAYHLPPAIVIKREFSFLKSLTPTSAWLGKIQRDGPLTPRFDDILSRGLFTAFGSQVCIVNRASGQGALAF